MSFRRGRDDANLGVGKVLRQVFGPRFRNGSLKLEALRKMPALGDDGGAAARFISQERVSFILACARNHYQRRLSNT